MSTKIIKAVKTVARKKPPEPRNLAEFMRVVIQAVENATKGGSAEIVKGLSSFLDELVEAGQRIKLSLASALKKIEMEKAERSILSAFGQQEWGLIIKKAQSQLNAFADAQGRSGAIAAFKGFLNEVSYFHSPGYRKAFNRAELLAKRLSKADPERAIDPDSVRLVRNIHDGQGQELTDGMIVGTQKDGRTRILTVLEIKSPSNKAELGSRPSKIQLIEERAEKGRKSGFRREGQFSSDVQRLENEVVVLDGTTYNPGELVFSIKNTEWLGVVPRGRSLGKGTRDRIKREIPGFVPENHAVRDRILNELAEVLLKMFSR